jgi:MFS family permease
MRSIAYRHYLLGLLTVILVFNTLDRVALGLLIQNIKADLHLNDTQLGFLSGIAFALFYSVMGIPIARWADRGNRVRVIAITIGIWSVAVALCGAAGSFVQLMLIRIVVAVGEAGCIPVAFALMADYFSRAERPRAAAIYGLGGPLSSVVGFLFVGWLNEFYGWRLTFVLIGAPGLVLTAVAWLTRREPRAAKVALGAFSPERVPSAAPLGATPSIKKVCVTLWASATFRHLLLCLSVEMFFLYGIFVWLPAFFIRTYGLTTGITGTWLALTFGLGGMLGSYLGGALASRHAANNERLQLTAMAIAIATAGVLSTLVYLAPNVYSAFGLVALSNIGLTTVNGPLFATLQTLVPERMRTVSFALVYFFGNLIGMGLGPLAAGALSDALRHWAGEDSLRYSLLFMSPGYLWAAWHAWQASKSVTGDLAKVREEDVGEQVARREREDLSPISPMPG